MADSILRDIDREWGKMQEAIGKLNQRHDNLQGYVQQYIERTTIEWAKLVANHPKSVLLIVETTRILDENGYASSGDSEPIRFTSLSLVNGAIWDQLIRPTYSRQVSGTEYHGLTMADLVNTPHIDEAWENIAERLTDHHVIIFGADWARNALRTVKQTYILDGASCLHNKVKEYFGEFYELSLEKALGYWMINKTREQLCDSRERILILHQVVDHLAAGITKQSVDLADEISGTTDNDHPF